MPNRKTQQKKEALLTANPCDEWAQRVEKMPTAQISAIYLRLLEQGKIK